MWIPAEHSDDDNIEWARLRAIEWGRWPLFLSQVLAPALLVSLSWPLVVSLFFAANLIWAILVRYRCVSVSAAYWAVVFVLLRWLVWPAATIYCFVVGRRSEAWVCAFWPVLMFALGAFTPTKVDRIQFAFLQSVGFTHEAHGRAGTA